MSDLHEVRDHPEREPQIDTEGWLFLVLAIGIITAAVMVAYKANDTMVANTTVSRDLVRVNLFEGVPKYPDRCAC